MKKAKRKPAREKNPPDRGRVLNVLESRQRETDWEGESLVLAQGNGRASNLRLPDVVDLTERKSWWRRAEDQKQTGACVGFSVGSVLWYLLVMKKRVPNYGRRYKPNYEELWRRSKETDAWTPFPTVQLDHSGTYIKDCLSEAVKRGVILEKDFPAFKGADCKIHESQFYVLTAQNKATAYFGVRPDAVDGPAHSTFRQWLARQQSPIVTRLNIDDNFANARRRTFILEDYEPDWRIRGHAVVICGYKPGYYLVKNSWGSRWGNRGYVWVSDAYAAAAFTESYGITMA